MSKESCKGRFWPIKRYGFTLIEMLVVVLVIGILGAIAIPQYQKAVLKSRYAALMPVAKSVADANEVYYAEHSQYAARQQDLSITRQADAPDGTQVNLSPNPEYAYVIASNPALNNNYVVYQKQSVQYPGEIHCEALKEDDLAEGVCKSFGATRNIGTTITSTHDTWLLEGSGAGIEPGALEDDVDENGQKVFNCDKATQLGYSCEMTENEDGSKTKTVCNTADLPYGSSYGPVCRSTTQNPDGSYFAVTCATSLTYPGQCSSAVYSEYFDDQGHLISTKKCSSVRVDGSCSSYSNENSYDYIYDKEGRLIGQRQCSSRPRDGSCGKTWGSYSYDYLYDAAGNQIARISCTRSSEGTCSPQSTQYYAYDDNGNMIDYSASCTEYNDEGVCTATKSNSYTVLYNEDGQTSARLQGSNVSAFAFKYDKNGNVIARYVCTGKYVHSDGTCDQYQSGTFYSYDANKNITSQIKCSNVANDGTCSEYSQYDNYYVTYDGNKMTHVAKCKSFDNEGKCSEYVYGIDLFYDEGGNLTHTNNCTSTSIVNSATGECNSYDVGYVFSGSSNTEGYRIPPGDTTLTPKFY